MTRIPVSSSQIKSIVETLEVEFNTGGVYQYTDFPKEVWNRFSASESIGSFFYKNIKGKYNYSKVS